MDPKQLKYSLESAYLWIEKSFLVNQGKGSSAYFSLIKGWSPPYPETTGYLIPSLIEYYNQTKSDSALRLLEGAVNWILSLQKEDGSFRTSEKSEKAIAFDTAQIFHGLQEYQDRFETTFLAEAINKCYSWLLSCIANNGLITKNTYHPEYSPSYHSRILWPLLAYATSKNLKSEKNIIDSSQQYALLQNEKGAFLNWGFEKNDPFGLTHTIAYTLRGFLEIGLLTDDKMYFDLVEKSLNPLVRSFSEKGKLAGRYAPDWTGDYSFECNSGNAQLAIIFYKMAAILNQNKYLLVADKLLDDLLKRQCLRSPLKSIKGGIFGSAPFYGKYQRFRIANWTLKFYMDLTMLKLNIMNT